VTSGYVGNDGALSAARMNNDWTSIRRKLGTEFLYGPGHWFCVPHDSVYTPDGRRFSERAGGTGRRVVLASDHGPNSIVFARSASRETAFSHPAHIHDGELGTCALDKDGWIAYKSRVIVSAAQICEETYSCREPDEEWLLSELRKARAQ